MIFRPPSFDLPPARGRSSLELLPDGVLRQGTPGPDDRRVWGDGSWALEGDVLTVRPDGQAEQRYRVEVDPDRLVLRPNV